MIWLLIDVDAAEVEERMKWSSTGSVFIPVSTDPRPINSRRGVNTINQLRWLRQILSVASSRDISQVKTNIRNLEY